MPPTALSRHDALAAVYAAIDEIAGQLEAGARIEKTPDTPLLGDGSPLDSLALINLIVALEEIAARRRGRPVQLLDEDLLGEQDGPYRTPATLAEHLAAHLADAA